MFKLTKAEQEVLLGSFTGIGRKRKYTSDGNLYLYHIHIPRDKNSLDKGYIGISDLPIRRWHQHLNAVYKARLDGTSHPLYRFMIDNFVQFSIVYGSSNPEEIISLERALRPEAMIGLNKGKGGVHKAATVNEELVSKYLMLLQEEEIVEEIVEDIVEDTEEEEIEEETVEEDIQEEDTVQEDTISTEGIAFPMEDYIGEELNPFKLDDRLY